MAYTSLVTKGLRLSLTDFYGTWWSGIKLSINLKEEATISISVIVFIEVRRAILSGKLSLNLQNKRNFLIVLMYILVDQSSQGEDMISCAVLWTETDLWFMKYFTKVSKEIFCSLICSRLHVVRFRKSYNLRGMNDFSESRDALAY